MRHRFQAFIDKLANTSIPGDVFNQYSHEWAANSVRRQNLLLYLEQMAEWRPRLLLVGEAPGYRGCRLTGVPLTSEFIILNGVDRFGLFGETRGYRKTDEFQKVWKEPTATIIWETLVNVGVVALSWNAFPFHPFQNANPWSNRTPRKEELKIGGEFLKKLMGLFEIEAVVAVGNKAQAGLRNIGIPCRKVRHPANGGKAGFVIGMNAVIRAGSCHS